ncbi:MAG: hypothetical protein V3R83_09740 [Gammaproteobacteria bacterium]
MGDGANARQVEGIEAADAAVSGNPVAVGGRANANEPTAVSNGDAVYDWRDLQGRTVGVNNFPAVVSGANHGPKTITLSSTTQTDVVAAPGAGQSVYVTGISASNTSSTFARLDLKDGTTVRVSMGLAADGGGFVMEFNPPWKITANTAFTSQLSATVTDVRVNAHFFTAP